MSFITSEIFKKYTSSAKNTFLSLSNTKSDLDMNGKSINNIKEVKYNDRIDLLTKNSNPDFNIRIGYVKKTEEHGKQIEKIETGIQLNQGHKFIVNGCGHTLISLTGSTGGTKNVIRGNETLEIKSGEKNGMRFGTEDAGITYESATWTERFKAFVMEVTKGIKMVAKDNSYWWVDAEKKAVYGNSLNKLEFRTDGEAKFSKDVRAKNVTVEDTLVAKNVQPNALWGKSEKHFLNCVNVLDFEGENFTLKLKKAIENNDGFTPIFIPFGTYEVDHTIEINIMKPNLYLIGEYSVYDDNKTILSDYPRLCIGYVEGSERRVNLLKFENLKFNVCNSQLVYYSDQEYDNIYETVFLNCELRGGQIVEDHTEILSISTVILKLNNTVRDENTVFDVVTDEYGGVIGSILETNDDGCHYSDNKYKLKIQELNILPSYRSESNITIGEYRTINIDSDNLVLKGELQYGAPTEISENRYSIPITNSDGTTRYLIVGNTANDLVNYYLKCETYTQEEINQLISSIPKFSIQVVSSLPENDINNNCVYLLKSGEENNNLYTEYIYVENKWEKLGTQKLDLSGYALKENIPTLLSQLNNDTNFVTKTVEDLVNYYSKKDVDEKLMDYAKTSSIPKSLSNLHDDTEHRLLTDIEKTKYTSAYEHSQLQHAPINAQENIIESITVNGELQETFNKNVNITIPTNFVTKETNNLINYYTKQDIDKLLKELQLLPVVTEADNGKTLKVVNGVWTLVEDTATT